MPADGVTLSGVCLQIRTKNGCGSGESRKTGTEGARQRKLLNLSGKRTEWVNVNLTSSRPFSRRSILLAAFFICQNEIKEVKQKWKQF